MPLHNQNKNAFPSDTQKNPKDCMEVQLRSGRSMSNSKAKEKEKTNKKEEKETGGDHGKSMIERTTETEKQV